MKNCDTDEQDAFVFFDEEEHLEKPFENPMQRHRFIEEIKLSVPIDIYRFCPGGSALSTVCFVRVNENRMDPQMLTQAARFVMAHKHRFKEYHSRAQKTAFKSQLSNVSHVLPSVAELIYKELALDASVSSHPDTQERIRLIFLGEKGLLTDLRKLNPGRPSGTFDIFFDNLSKVVEEATAADERRHGTAHLSHWISLEDMIREAKDKCPNTPVPSKALVRLQFAPCNPFAKTSWNFTSRIDVQYKIQTRQLRLTHQDEHYCNALLKYLKEYAIEMKEKCRLVMICCDDKAKIPIGEPGFAVSTGVRGKKTVTPTSVTLTAGDHDMTKSSLTPSVTLQNDIPKSCDDSFVRGKVTVTVNDSVFQSSNPFRHAVTVSNILAGQGPINILMKYTDGGTDHRNTLESVKCASICLFREMNLDMLILGRCAPGHSWRNQAERVMSLLNLGLQNCSSEKGVCSEEMEKKLKRMGSMKEIRSKAEPETRKAYKESVEPVQSVIQNRFGRLKLKNEPVCVKDPITDNEIDVFQRHLRELFPGLNLEKLQKQHTSKVAAYVQ